MLQEQIAVKHSQHSYQFSIANLAVSQTGTDIPVLGAVMNTYLMPKDGYIVGYSIGKSAAHTAGSLDFDIEVGGSSTLTIAADTASVYKTLDTPNEPFSAGDTIGVTYTSDGSLLAVTVDVVVTIFVVFKDFEF